MSQLGDRRHSSYGTGRANLHGGIRQARERGFLPAFPKLTHDAPAIRSHAQAPVDHPAEIPRPSERSRVPARSNLRLPVCALPADTRMPVGSADSGEQVEIQADHSDPERSRQPGSP